MASASEGVEQEMEVHEPTEGPPGACQLGHGVITGGGGEPEAATEVVTGPDVVAGQHVIAAKASEQCVLSAPASDTREVEQDLKRHVVGLVPERLEIELPCGHPLGENLESSDFCPAESQPRRTSGSASANCSA